MKNYQYNQLNDMYNLFYEIKESSWVAIKFVNLLHLEI